ncbi:Ankyrin repeat domain-containing protein 17 [Colletotrichum aenigma]|uniref:Ankyrin repeat domain-containing protein 17 n=1 Tax=Colletotrichum aenigma TaxID=1215731 RepID=UPI001872F7FF|nr:Ankyrin repeat domain-containing protein 17 [Colletotrichum aenigma]KAF5521317.1 Ankyrin repeat domain-containing protein 17 [Colletotrichum aenigma]
MPRLKKFIEAMIQFGLTIEVFVNANDFVCFIWGPMKFLLVTAKNHLDTFDKLLDIFEQHPTLKLVLQDYYSDILEFHQAALSVLIRPRMFLYARVVLEYLYRQVSLGKLKKAIRPDVFPEKLENAYERIVTSIFESEHESEREAAKKTIALVVTAKRDLKWREIQSFFCIDSDEWILDSEERLQLTAKELCVNSLPSDDTERTTLLDIEQRTSWIRQNIESLNDLTFAEHVILDDLYGTIPVYKCPKPVCSMFSEGFDTTHKRAQHINRHDRRFLCNFQFCFGQAFGYDSQVGLKDHVKDYHENPPVFLQFPQKERRSRPEYDKDNLLQVMRFEDIDRVIELLDGGADINAVDGGKNDYHTPLWRAVDRKNYKLCELLIDRGANLGKPASYQPKQTKTTKAHEMPPFTPLAHACAKGNIKIADLILQAYAKSITFADSGIRIALMKAVVQGHLEIVQLLTSFYDFSQEKDIENGPDDPLVEACERHNPSMVEFLSQNGFKFKRDVDYVAKCLPSPMRFLKNAMERWHRVELTLKVLLKTAKPTITSFTGIWRAIDYQRPSIALLLLSYPETNLAADGLSILRHKAEQQGYNDIVKLTDRLLA